MDESGGVDDIQSVQQRHHYGAQLGLTAYLLGFEQFFQALAAFVLHHHVGGAVRLEHTHHPYDVGVAEFRQGAGLGDESIQTPTVSVAVVLGDGMDVAVVAAGREFHRQKLFYRDTLIQVRIQGQIGNAEAALADHRADHVPVQCVTAG